MDFKQCNGLSLAYYGDAVYEMYIRKYLLSLGLTNVNTLHKRATSFTSGVSQANFMHYFLNENILTEQEISIFKRGRNSHVHTTRKNIDVQIYMEATGFEALIGYLYLDNQVQRVEELINLCINIQKGE